MSGNNKTFIIAEAGVNHNGQLEIAEKLIVSAAESGADAVKFQTFKADNLVCRQTPKADYQMESTRNDESQYQMLKKLELGEDAHKRLFDCCMENGIQFLSSPFDLLSIDLLNSMGLDVFKIPSGEITNLPFLRKIGGLKKKIILSSGMSEIEEIKKALDILVLAGMVLQDITVLHCTTQYPAPVDSVNLKAMQTIKQTFPGIEVGYSDHTAGIEVAIAAVAMGAKVIEKHFTLDTGLAGPDHKASLNPVELKQMVTAIRKIEKCFGNGRKSITAVELKNRDIVRKSIVASRDIQKGEPFTKDNLTVKRPGTGMSPMKWDDLMGKQALKSYKTDDLL